MALFRGGIPTGMDVTKLMTTFDVRPGTRVSYEEIESATGLTAGTSRFATVTLAWRKRIMREHFIQSKAEGGAIVFLTPDEAHDQGKRGLRQIGRAAGRLAVRVEMINANELSDDRRNAHNLLRRETQAMLDAARKSAKVIAAPKAVSESIARLAKE